MPDTIREDDNEDKLRMLVSSITDMTTMLKKQADLLAQRNLVLPKEPLQQLQGIAADLARISENLGGEQIELSQLRELARTTNVISSTLDLDTVLNSVIDTTVVLTGAERGYIMLKDTVTGSLEFRVARNLRQSELEEYPVSISLTVTNHVVTTGEPIVTTNAENDPRLSGSDSIAAYAIRSILCAPLKRKGEVIGVLYLDNRIRPGVFSPREQRLIYAFANQAAIAIDNARLFERVRASLEEVTSLRDFMENVFASIASGVIATGADDEITTINAAAARILGISREMSIGKSLWSVLPPLYAGFNDLFGAVRTANRKQTIEVDPVIDSRGQISLNLQLSPLKDSMHITRGVTMVLDDLTELKQRQAQLSAVRRYLPPALVDNIKKIDELELGGVEREITLVACDVRGFSTFSENLPPDELMLIINKFLSVSTTAIHEYQGIVDKYMGDAAVGIYNSQLNPQEDHAIRGVKAAIYMARAVNELHQTLPEGQRLLFGIGVHTGTAILGNVGSPRRKEFTVIGDILVIAKNLQDSAPGGQIYISEETYALVKGYVTAEPAQPRKGKELSEPMNMLRITGYA